MTKASLQIQNLSELLGFQQPMVLTQRNSLLAVEVQALGLWRAGWS